MSIAATQRSLVSAIVEQKGGTGLLRPWHDGGTARIGIYQEAYRARLIDALADNYPVLQLVLGDERFAELALSYLAAQPSRHPSIRWFGHALDAYLEANPDLIPHAALVDLVRLEWALRGAFDGPDATPLSIGELASLPPELWPEQRFAAHPTVALLSLEWMIEPLWHALREDPNAQTPAPSRTRHTLVVWRSELQTHWRTLDADEALLLPACLSGDRFDELCIKAQLHCSGDAALRVAGLLRLWIEAGLLVTPAPKT